MSRQTARERILSAAAEVAQTDGAGNLSLDAVAAKAGVSKGGLLYHFPSKAALLRAVVEFFVADFEARLDATVEKDGKALQEALVELTITECAKPKPGGAGVLAAIADDPDFMLPIKAFQRRLLDRLLAESADRSRSLLVYLALEGLRSHHLFGVDSMSAIELEQARRAMLEPH